MGDIIEHNLNLRLQGTLSHWQGIKDKGKKLGFYPPVASYYALASKSCD